MSPKEITDTYSWMERTWGFGRSIFGLRQCTTPSFVWRNIKKKHQNL